MNVVLYANGKNGTELRRLQDVVHLRVKPEHVELYQSFFGLYSRLHQLPRDIDVAVLFAHDNEQLMQLVSLREMTEDIYIILVIGNGEMVDMNQAHRLKPRFIEYADGHLPHIADVLEKMMTKKYLQKN